MAKPKLFVSFRDHTVVQPKTGVTARFFAKQPRSLRASMHLQAQAEGIVPYTPAVEAAINAELSGSDYEELDDPVEEPAPLPDEPEETASTIEEAIDILLKRGEEADFSPVTQQPKIASLRQLLGRNVTAEERDEAWEKVDAKMPGVE